FMSVAPPDGFSKWSDAEWERWLRDHPWEAAERICSRGDWSIFLYQIREHSQKGRKVLEPLLESLVNERPLSAQDTEDLRDALDLQPEAMIDARTTGTGIAHVTARAGYVVEYFDVAPGAPQKALERIADSLARAVEKGRCTAQEREEALKRLSASSDLDAAAG